MNVRAIDRRRVVAGGLALPFAGAARVGAQTPPVPIADMHFHSFFGESKFHSRPVAKALADGGATLVAWKIVGDSPWIAPVAPHKQIGEPAPGAALARLRTHAGLIRTHMSEQNLKLALTPEDVDAAVRGEPRIVLSVEGANFIESDPARVKVAYDLGIRHIQIVHYTRNPLADFQTEQPTLNGLTDVGKAVIAECNRLGILVDLAHCTPRAVEMALAVTKVPPVWSHGSVARAGEPNFKMVPWKARQLTIERAKTIAKAGGVVGIWGLKVDIGATTDAYANRMLELADWIGDQHVGFGTDINGLGEYAMLHSYTDVRAVVAAWQRKGVPEKRVRAIAGGNYARVLKQAMAARTT